MIGKHKVKKAVKGFDKKKSDEPNLIPAILGFRLQGQNRVEVPNRDGYVYARISDNLSETIQAYNDQVAPVYGLAVLLFRDKKDRGRYKVYGRDLGRYQDWGSTTYVPRHGNSHSFIAGGGGDVIWVYSQQFMPLLAIPSGTNGSNTILIYPYSYNYLSQWKQFAVSTSTNLFTYKPTGTSARMVLVYLNQDTNALGYSAGAFFSATLTGTSDVIPYLPSPSSSQIPIAGVRLLSGTSSLVWENLYDVRPFFTAAGGGGGAGLNAVRIFDDSAFIVSGTSISFDNGLSVSVTGTTAYINNTGAGATGTIFGGFPSNHPVFGSPDGGLISDINYLYYETGIVTGNSRLLIGDISLPYISSSNLALVRDGGSVGLGIHSYGGIAVNSAFVSRGTKASPLGLLADDNMFWWSFGGYDGSAWAGAKAIIKVKAAGDWSGSARGTYWEFLATETGTNTTSVAQRIDAKRVLFSGDVTVSGTLTADLVYARNLTGSMAGGGHAIYDDGVLQTQRGKINFVGAGFVLYDDGGNDTTIVSGTASGSGSGGSGTAMYMLAGIPTSLNGSPTGLYWKVPGDVMATGTLSIFINGVSKLLGTDYQVQYSSSGTYQLLGAPPTGSVHFAMWDVDKVVGGVSTTTINTVTASEILGVQIFS